MSTLHISGPQDIRYVPPWARESAINLGGRHSYTTFQYDQERHPESPDIAGIVEWHIKPDGTPCGGAVNFWRPPGDKGPVWQVELLDPLTISPSVLCSPEKGGCGSHGWIKNGRWVDA